MARLAFKPTEAQKHLVKGMSSCGIRQQDIAAWVGLRSPKTLRKHFREELDRGRIGADIEVGKPFLRWRPLADVRPQRFTTSTAKRAVARS